MGGTRVSLLGVGGSVLENACHIDENGLYQGEFIARYQDGTIFVRCFYVDDKRHGEYRDYHENGSPWEIRHYRHGVLHGDHYWFTDDGDVFATMYHNGVDLGIDPRGLSDRDKLYVLMSGRMPENGIQDVL